MQNAVAKKTTIAKKPTTKNTTAAKTAVAKKTMTDKNAVAKKTTIDKNAVAKKTTIDKNAVARKTTKAKKPVAKNTTAAKTAVAKKTTIDKNSITKKATIAKKAATSKKTTAKETWRKEKNDKDSVSKVEKMFLDKEDDFASIDRGEFDQSKNKYKKNVLKPVNLTKSKNEIMAARKNIPTQVSLTHFKEKVAFIINASVKGEDANKLVTQIQKCFINIHKREKALYENVDTIYRVIETISKDNIEGIIVAIKTAQTAIDQAEYAIEHIKMTLKVLKDFKNSLEMGSKHLGEVDILWDKTETLSSSIDDLDKDIKEINNSISELFGFKRRLEKCKHIDDIDKIFEECQKLNDRIKILESD